jgi:hypothetical protein
MFYSISGVQVLLHLLPDGIICLLPVFKDTSSVSSITSPCKGFRTLLGLVLGILKLSR